MATGAAELKTSFDRDGFVVVSGFASEEECDGMMAQMGKLLDEWDSGQEVAAFSTAGDQEEAQGSSSYFMNSADRICFFLETAATNEDGVSLKPGFDKHTSINKVSDVDAWSENDALCIPTGRTLRPPTAVVWPFCVITTTLPTQFR
eukprot:m.243934 g.243934  ORF g.243934 m.243934 type:complete len:147 (+) comp15838_c0_seq1:99-539(+)